MDTIWGIGLPPDNADIDNIYAWRGQNLLGFALMEVRDFLKEFGHFQPLDNAVEAPWTKFPSVALYDMFWRMGLGEAYMMHFSTYFDGLTDREKMIYQLTNPAPYDWANYYA